MSDPAPYVRFEAAAGVWRWYYWQVDKHDVRRGALEALATRLNTEHDAMVRRGLEESVYDLLDENTGYLSAWVRASAQEEDWDKIKAGYEVLKAGSTLSEAGSARFTLAALNLSEDPNPDVRETVRYVYESGQRGVLNLNAAADAPDGTTAPDAALVAKVVEILRHGSEHRAAGQEPDPHQAHPSHRPRRACRQLPGHAQWRAKMGR